MKPEELLHLFGPYLPTDRFRALLCGRDLPMDTNGSALLVDISGFTPLTTRLVTEYGAQRASEELKRRLNPMFEAIAGQVFHHGGSVIRFTGDGFIAWFDEQTIDQVDEHRPDIPAVLRATAAGLGMQGLMPLFRGLKLKVCIGVGHAHRWVVGQPEHGLMDVLSGPALQSMLSLAGEAQADQVMVHSDAIPIMRDNNLTIEFSDLGNAVVSGISDNLSQAARLYRWPAWAIDGNVNDILNAVQPFVASAIRQQVESGFGDFVGELRYAIPMFVQFAGMGEHSHETSHIALNGYIHSVQDILANFGGRLVSVEVGDKGSVVFAVFGAPITYGDDGERAVSAAIALRDSAISEHDDLALRIGISRGLLYAGTIGGEVRHEYSTIGDETNVAARLMSSAKSKQILVSASVHHEAGSRIIFNDLPPIHVKGKSEAIPVSEAVSIQSGGQRRSHAGEFVGRETELSRLRKLLKAVKHDLPRVLRLEGQAGIGKSRLIAEFIRIATEDTSFNFAIAGGECASTGRSTVYLPWREVMFSLLDLNLEQPNAENIARLHTITETTNPDWLPRLPLLGDLLQLQIPETPTTSTLEGRTRRQALFALVIDMILYFARQKPLMIVIEDIQWIDEGSEALTAELSRRLSAESIPIMLVLIHRPLIENETPKDLIETITNLHLHNHMGLDELSRPDVTTMIEKYLDASAPPELSRFIYERARGNPFFIQEVIDTLIETGYIEPIGSRIFIEKDLEACDLPRTVQGLVQARIDRLSEIDKLVLKVAAVIGREFQVKVLAQSIPIPMGYEELMDHLRILEERDFSHLEVPEPDLTYLFKHAITQEVTYQSLLFAQRRQLHLAVATTLEVMVPDAIEQLAYHFARSGENERAKEYLIIAGQKAFREYANQAALGYFTQAIEFASSDHERFDFGTQRLQVMLRLGDMQNVQAELPRMQHLAVQHKRTDWQAIVHIFWANYHTQTSAWAQAAEEAQKAIELAGMNDLLAWDAYLLLHSTLLRMNRQQDAEELLKQMQDLAERADSQRRGIQLVLMEIESLYAEAPDMAIRGAQSAVKQAEALHDPVLEAECWSTLASLCSRENDLPSALDASRQQISLLRQIGDRRREGLTLNQIGITLVKLGQLSECNAHLLDAYRILHQIGERAGEATSLVYLGVVEENYKAYDGALAYMKRGLALQRSLNAGADAALTLFYMGNVYIAKQDFDEAIKVLEEARTLLLANNLTQHLDEIDMALAEIEMHLGDLAAAKEHIKPLLMRLMQRQVSDMFRPGLIYWRATQVLTALEDMNSVEELRAAFRTEANTIISKLPDRDWRACYIDNIWYHAQLLGRG